MKIIFYLWILFFSPIVSFCQCHLDTSEFDVADSSLSVINTFFKGNEFEFVEYKFTQENPSPKLVRYCCFVERRLWIKVIVKSYNKRKISRIRYQKSKYFELKKLIQGVEKGSYVYSCPQIYSSKQSSVIEIRMKNEKIFKLLNIDSQNISKSTLKSFQDLYSYLFEYDK